MARLRHLLVAPLLLLAGCGSPFVRDWAGIRQDVQDHLTDTYGERFVITRVVGQTGSGGWPVDAYNLTVHPTRDPSLAFQASIDYRRRPPRLTDRYRCVQLERWLPDAIVEALGPRHRIETVQLLCRDSLPTHPRPGTRLPEGSVEVRATVESYLPGDPLEVAGRSRDLYVRAGETLGFQARGEVHVYPPAVWAYAATFEPPDDFMKEGRLDEWGPLRLARARLDRAPPPQAYVPAAEVEAAAHRVLDRVAPEAARSVRARYGEPASTDGIPRLDVRVAGEGLDQARAEAILRALHEGLDARAFRLVVVDQPAGGGPQRAAWTCRGIGARCQPARGRVLGPEWQATPGH